MNNRNLIRYLSRFSNEELEQNTQFLFRDKYYYYFTLMNQEISIPVEHMDMNKPNDEIVAQLMDYLEATND